MKLWARFLALPRWQQIVIGLVVIVVLLSLGRNAGVVDVLPLPDIR